MSEENKANFRRFMDEVINNKNLDAIDELMTADYIDHDPPPGVEPGAAGMKQMMGMFFAAFPDLSSNVIQLVAEGDLVVGVMTTTGTHKGEFMGVPATGKRFSMTEVHMVRVVDGKAVEHWGVGDSMAMMQQLGAIPSA